MLIIKINVIQNWFNIFFFLIIWTSKTQNYETKNLNKHYF